MRHALLAVLMMGPLSGCHLKNLGGSASPPPEHRGRGLEVWVEEFNAGNLEATVALQEALADARLRPFALKALTANLRVDGAVLQESVIAILENDGGSANRILAMDCLQKLGGDRERTRQALLKQANNSSVAIAAIDSLFKTPGPLVEKLDQADALLVGAAAPNRRHIVDRAIKAIHQGPRAGPDQDRIRAFFHRLRDDADVEVRRKVIWGVNALDEAGKSNNIDLYRFLVNDQDWTVRSEAARTLVELDPAEPRLVTILAEAVDRKEWGVLVQLLGRLQGRAAPVVPKIVALLQSLPLESNDDRDRVLSLARALQGTGQAGQQALPTLERLQQRIQQQGDASRTLDLRGIIDRMAQ